MAVDITLCHVHVHKHTHTQTHDSRMCTLGSAIIMAGHTHAGHTHAGHTCGTHTVYKAVSQKTVYKAPSPFAL